MPDPPMMPRTDLAMPAPYDAFKNERAPNGALASRNIAQHQCTADQTFFLVKYMSPASTIRKIITWKPMRLRCTRCGSAAHIRNAETSLEYCATVVGVPS